MNYKFAIAMQYEFILNKIKVLFVKIVHEKDVVLNKQKANCLTQS